MKKYKFTATIEQGDRNGAYVLFSYDGRSGSDLLRVPELQPSRRILSLKTNAKTEQTRLKRIAKAIDMLKDRVRTPDRPKQLKRQSHGL